MRMKGRRPPLASSMSKRATPPPPPIVLSDDDVEFIDDDNLDLSEMFASQRRFMELLKKHREHPDFPVDMSTKDGQRYVKDIAHDCMHELFEAVHLLKDAKKHRATIVGGFNRDAFLEELADTLHFFIGLCILAGVDASELHGAYVNKGQINVNRVLSGY